MPQTLYYAQLDEEFFGPFALSTLREMRLTPDVTVLSTETNDWKPAGEYPELAGSLDLSEFVPTEEISQPATSTGPAPTFDRRSIFYIRRDNTPYGPYTLEALATASVTDDTDVSLDGMTSWYKAGHIAGLLNTLSVIAAMGPTDDKAEEPNPDMAELLNRICGLTPGKKQLYRRVFATREAERNYLIGEYNRIFATLLNLVKSVTEMCSNATLSRRATHQIKATIEEVTAKINNHYLAELSRLDASGGNFTAASIAVGRTDFSLLPPLADTEFERIDFLTVLGDKNLLVTYDSDAENAATDFVNTVVGKLYRDNPARLIVTDVVDLDYMTGLDDAFKMLSRDLYQVISRPEDARGAFAALQDRAGTILRNLLVEKGATLQDYNATHENKEANVLLVVKDFPHGLTPDNLALLKKLATVGPKVGIYMMILTNRDYVDDMTERESEVFSISDFAQMANTYHFKKEANNWSAVLDSDASDSDAGVVEGNVHFDTLSDADLRKVVKDVNAKCELKEDVIVAIADYLPDSSEWWKASSAKQIEIPFGLGNDMHVKTLKITQESGQNTAVVIGIPGSGKSVFLHSLICNAAMKYSPDELRMYLIDFSGVEFNSYALGKLPHARVIAPEAEREFGLSVLNELVEEGSRRMSLCRDHNVSNIVDLKKVAPEAKVPRLLVIIDEFQKLFEIENDAIAREANSKIHIIIQEFRKFGINLILATQKLPSASFVPRDLIANRVVFKSAPADFATLISSVDKEGMPRMRTGQCVYNSESGAAYANELVQGFYTSRTDIDNLLAAIADFEKRQDYEREQIKVFRSAEQPQFTRRRMLKHHQGFRGVGQSIPVYVGESVSVSDFDVNFELNHEGGNNLLIVGGESAVAEGICFYSLLSVSTAHNAGDATFVIINGMRTDNPLTAVMTDTIGALPFKALFPTRIEDIEATLTEIKAIIDERRETGATDYNNVYIGVFDAQNCRAFDPVSGGRTERPSNSATLMEYVLKNGPAVGIFTFVQVDNLASLMRIGSVMSVFNHRVALQMPERESQNVMRTEAASKLFVFNRPSSIYRAYLYDNIRNTSIKFKPYK